MKTNQQIRQSTNHQINRINLDPLNVGDRINMEHFKPGALMGTVGGGVMHGLSTAGHGVVGIGKASLHGAQSVGKTALHGVKATIRLKRPSG